MAKWKEIKCSRCDELSILHREYEKLLRERIEQLAATNEELEDKLQKAIGALEKVQAFVRDLEPHADQGHTLVPALREACETLAELNYDERSEKKGED